MNLKSNSEAVSLVAALDSGDKAAAVCGAHYFEVAATSRLCVASASKLRQVIPLANAILDSDDSRLKAVLKTGPPF